MWTQEENANLVSALRSGDHNGFVRVLEAAVDRLLDIRDANTKSVGIVALRPRGDTKAVRALDTDFIISPDRDARVAYTILLPIRLLAIGSDESTVALFVNGVEISRVTNQMSIGVGLSISDIRQPRMILSGHIPAGSTVNITTIAASSYANPSVVESQETLL